MAGCCPGEPAPKKRPRQPSPMHAAGEPDEAINPYHILRVRRDATPSEIREAYRRLALWNHPTRRTDLFGAEEIRRQQMFIILAACYETLQDNDARILYDVLLQKQSRGTALAGGKPWVPTTTPRSYPQLEPIFSGCDDLDLVQESTDIDIPALMSSASIDSDDYEGDDDDYLASGELSFSDYSHDMSLTEDPLKTLRQARRGRPFSDPFDVFDGVFGSQIFPRIPLDGHIISEYQQRTPRSAAWIGTTNTSKDGTKVSTTSRILNDRLLIRTDTTSREPNGRTRTVVTVEGKDLPEEQELFPLPTGIFGCNSCLSTEDSFTDWICKTWSVDA